MKHLKLLFLLFFSGYLSSCAVPHHIQLGDMDDREYTRLHKFDFKVSEFGIDLHQVKVIAQGLSSKKSSKNVGTAGSIFELFYMGPTTGNMVLNDKYADTVVEKILDHCPSGKVTGLTIIRETMSYPVISGEIIRITGYCIN